MASIFTKIIEGEIPCYKVAESDRYFAFLDIRPMAKGHTLVIPKQETDVFFHLEDDLLAGIMPFAKRIAKALERVVECDRVGVVVAGLEVPHAHVHLIPMTSMRDLSFDKVPIEYDADEMKELSEAIRKEVSV